MKKFAVLSFLLCTGGMLATTASAACYTVYDAKGEIISETSTAPVDMSGSINEAIARRFGPGARLAFGLNEQNCGPAGDAYGELRGSGSRAALRPAKVDRG